MVACSGCDSGNLQGWGGADATAALHDAGDAGEALASRALELEAELAALDHSMMQVPRADLHSQIAQSTQISATQALGTQASCPAAGRMATHRPQSAAWACQELRLSWSWLLGAISHLRRSCDFASSAARPLLQGMSMVSSQPATAAALEEQLRSWEADVARLEGLAEQVCALLRDGVARPGSVGPRMLCGRTTQSV